MEEKCPKCGSTDLREQSIARANDVVLRRVLDCKEDGCGGWVEIRYNEINHVIPEIREYSEGKPVEIHKTFENGSRMTVDGINEGGYSCTQIDLEDLLAWLSREMPELYAKFIPVPSAPEGT